MKFVFMAQTAYQLMNMIKFVYFDTEGAKGRSNIYISNKVYLQIFDKKKLIDSGLFSKVVVYKEKRYSDDKTVGKIDTFLNVVNRNAFKKQLEKGEEKGDAEIVVIPSVSLESQMFWQYIKHKKVYLIEDGLGSLTGNILFDGMRPSRRRLTEILYGSFRLDKMYLNNLNYNNSVSDTNFYEIPGKFSKELCSFLKEIFLPIEYESPYSATDVLYLQQPAAIWKTSYVEAEERLLRQCAKVLGNKLIVRCHPLTIDNPRLQGIRYDLQNYAWEAECIDRIDDTSIIMGIFSTAQFSPKLVFNREPHVIFMHKIITPTNITNTEIEKMIDVLKYDYSKKDKIHIPDSKEELLDILSEISR